MTTSVALFATTRQAVAFRPFDGTDASVAPEGDIEFEMGPVDWIASGRDDALAPTAGR